jgi:integrase
LKAAHHCALDEVTARASSAPASVRSAARATGLVFTTRTDRPVEPRNLVRSFTHFCDADGVRKIRLHALRHTTASLLKDLGAPPRDA